MDDDPDDQQALVRAFAPFSQWVEVQHFGDGEEVIGELAQARWPDLLITDLNMPLVGGLELLRHIRGQDRIPRLPVAVWTNSADDDDRLRCLAAGADAFSIKPYYAVELADWIIQLTTQWFWPSAQKPTFDP